MKFKLNDTVRMLTCTEWWQKGDIGKIVDIDDDNIPYLVRFDHNCTKSDCAPDECDKDYEWWWAKETDIELVRSLMKVE